MSRYAVNVFMRLVNMDPEALAAYVEDHPRFVADWLDRTGLSLSEDERSALEGRDYGALYAMGAHPYLLWSFTEAVWVPEITRPELVDSFRVQAARAGYPDWRTIQPSELP